MMPLLYLVILSIYKEESKVNQLANIFLNLIYNSILNFKPMNIRISLLKPICLPADKNPRRATDRLLRLFNLYLPLKHFHTFTVSNSGHRWQSGGEAFIQQTFDLIQKSVLQTSRRCVGQPVDTTLRADASAQS